MLFFKLRFLDKIGFPVYGDSTITVLYEALYGLCKMSYSVNILPLKAKIEKSLLRG